MESEILAILLEIAVFIVILFFTIQTIPAIPAHIITQLQNANSQTQTITEILMIIMVIITSVILILTINGLIQHGN